MAAYYGWIPLSAPGFDLESLTLRPRTIDKMIYEGRVISDSICWMAKKDDYSLRKKNIDFVKQTIIMHSKKDDESDVEEHLRTIFTDKDVAETTHFLIRDVKDDNRRFQKVNRLILLIFGNLENSRFVPLYASYVGYVTDDNKQKMCHMLFKIKLDRSTGLTEIDPIEEMMSVEPDSPLIGRIVQEIFYKIQKVYRRRSYQKGGSDGPDSIILSKCQYELDEALINILRIYKSKLVSYKDFTTDFKYLDTNQIYDVTRRATSELRHAIYFINIFGSRLFEIDKGNSYNAVEFINTQKNIFEMGIDAIQTNYNNLMSKNSSEHSIMMRWSSILIMVITVSALITMNVGMPLMAVSGALLVFGFIALFSLNFGKIVRRKITIRSINSNIRWGRMWGVRNLFFELEKDEPLKFPVSWKFTREIRKRINFFRRRWPD